jgi:toxin YoeB
MNLDFTDEAWADYLEWLKIDKKKFNKINELIKDIKRNPNNKAGIGKPEMLKGDLSGFMSRHINDEHRLVYKVENDILYIISCKYHYKK